MDWHHPDYTPRRPWEKNRSSDGAVFDRPGELRRASHQLDELVAPDCVEHQRGNNPGVDGVKQIDNRLVIWAQLPDPAAPPGADVIRDHVPTEILGGRSKHPSAASARRSNASPAKIATP